MGISWDITNQFYFELDLKRAGRTSNTKSLILKNHGPNEVLQALHRELKNWLGIYSASRLDGYISFETSYGGKHAGYI